MLSKEKIAEMPTIGELNRNIRDIINKPRKLSELLKVA